MFTLASDRRVARITLDRGTARNAIPIAGWDVLAALVDAAVAGGARALVIGSAVPGAFCAGADIAELATLAGDPARRAVFRVAMRGALDRLRCCPMPTIAEVRGGCFGAGVALAIACDIRVASPAARFAITPAKLGIAYPARDVRRLVDLVGRGQAARLLLSAMTIAADDARAIGLADAVAEDADGLARAIAANAPSSISALRLAIDGRFDDDGFDAAFGSADFVEGLAAYRARRAPDFG